MQAEVCSNNGSKLGRCSSPITGMHYKRLVLSRNKQISYSEYGTPQGHPLIYFHDVASSRLEARLIAKAAGEAGLRVIAVDRPGVGGTIGFEQGLQDYFSGLDELIAYLQLEKFSLITSGAAYTLGVSFARDRAQRVHSFTALSPRQASLLASFNGVPRFFKSLIKCLLRGFIHIRYHQFAAHPEQYFERYCESLCPLDRRSVSRVWVREAILDNVRESLVKGLSGLEWDIEHACMLASGEPREFSRFYAWSGGQDGAGLIVMQNQPLKGRRFAGSGRYFYLRHIGEILHAVKQGLADGESHHAIAPRKPKANAMYGQAKERARKRSA
ncbi:MAG: alpha/beta hydrolase [Pseudohongiellaceae bacterium]|nr:alpha/beta hydrolase [Pseudohongiellaceae bacterium]